MAVPGVPRAAILEIMDGIEALGVDQGARQQVRQLVRTVCTAHGFDWEREDRVAFARRLLGNRVSRPVVRDRLIATFDVSRKTAYRIIDTALQLSQKPNFYDTQQEPNGNGCEPKRDFENGC